MGEQRKVKSLNVKRKRNNSKQILCTQDKNGIKWSKNKTKI